MTDRERLVELINEAKRTYPETGSFTDYLADYLLEHGVIVLSCKAGNTLCCESAIKGHITYLVAPDDEWISKIGKFSEKEYSSPVKKRKKR